MLSFCAYEVWGIKKETYWGILEQYKIHLSEDIAIPQITPKETWKGRMTDENTEYRHSSLMWSNLKFLKYMEKGEDCDFSHLAGMTWADRVNSGKNAKEYIVPGLLEEASV